MTQDRQVQCAWCPMMLPDDGTEWQTHFISVHGFAGYSVKFIRPCWDITELTSAVDGKLRLTNVRIGGVPQ